MNREPRMSANERKLIMGVCCLRMCSKALHPLASICVHWRLIKKGGRE